MLQGLSDHFQRVSYQDYHLDLMNLQMIFDENYSPASHSTWVVWAAFANFRIHWKQHCYVLPLMYLGHSYLEPIERATKIIKAVPYRSHSWKIFSETAMTKFLKRVSLSTCSDYSICWWGQEHQIVMKSYPDAHHFDAIMSYGFEVN